MGSRQGSSRRRVCGAVQTHGTFAVHLSFPSLPILGALDYSIPHLISAFERTTNVQRDEHSHGLGTPNDYYGSVEQYRVFLSFFEQYIHVKRR